MKFRAAAWLQQDPWLISPEITTIYLQNNSNFSTKHFPLTILLGMGTSVKILLSLKIRVLESQLESAKETKKSTLDICELVKESTCLMRDEGQRHQKSNLEQILSDKRAQLEALKTELDYVKSQTMVRIQNMLQELEQIRTLCGSLSKEQEKILADLRSRINGYDCLF